MNNLYKSNVKLWDELSIVHFNSKSDEDLSINDNLTDIELEELGDIRGKKILHLQCHLGLESIQMASMGAEVTAIDYSKKAIEKAQLASKKHGINVDFVCTSVEDMLGVSDEYYDIVFASSGTIMWIRDMSIWAKNIASKLKKNGSFILIDEHPFAATLKFDSHKLYVGYKYKTDPNNPYLTFNENSYLQGADSPLLNTTQIKWGHGFSVILMSLVQNNMNIDKLNEYKKTFYKMFDDMQCDKYGWWEMKKNEFNIPLMFVLKTSKI